MHVLYNTETQPQFVTHTVKILLKLEILQTHSTVSDVHSHTNHLNPLLQHEHTILME